MKTLTDQLANYAAYHRDRRNIATHFVGIPMIVVAVATLLARPAWTVGGWPVSLATLVTLLTVLCYLRLDGRFGAAMALLMGAALVAGQSLATQSTAVWLTAGVGLFVVGWVFQFVGHVYEGRKPAFVDDLIGLIIGPLFVVAEAAFALGLRSDVLREIEARVGPTRGARSRPQPS
ncbi:MAG: DUF962 domain-containing protein [Burkholderiales bacterium]|jgi:uncharacterized membrane protein YGL010W|nr:DUF962 domain-containing protein [Burkholderiales bacterium]